MLKDSATEIRKLRHSTTQEDFTPEFLLEELADEFFSDSFKDPKKKFLDNSCGNGNIIIYVIAKKLDKGSSYIDALSTVYGIDFMEDNIKECYERILKLLDERGIEYDSGKVTDIITHNIVCYNALEWDYERWQPLVGK